MTQSLQALVRQAATELGSDACREGRHDWDGEGEGGRACPSDLTDHCGQAVYRCRSCGEYDYGEPGGPGHTDCLSCRFQHLREA